MAESSTFRSKYAAQPGSLSAIRVDYNRNITAFDAPGGDTHIGHRRSDVRRWRQGYRLGDKAEWNLSSLTSEKEAMFPQRPLMHTLSEYQAVKIDYNFRASTLPDINKKTVFVPKGNKMQIDRRAFLTPKEKSMLVDRCPATVSLLSTHEMRNHTLPGVERETGWNCSTALDDSRVSVFKLKSYDDYREVNKTKDIVDPQRYISPVRRQEQFSQTIRETKLRQREAEAEASRRRAHSHRTVASPTGDSKMVFKMSNIEQWWDLNPTLQQSSQNTPR
jgi:hypothetical protein